MHQPRIPENYAKLLKRYEGLGGTPNQEQNQFGYELFTEAHIFYNSDGIREHQKDFLTIRNFEIHV